MRIRRPDRSSKKEMMSKTAQTVLVALSMIGLVKPVNAGDSNAPLQVAPSVDLARYAGKWYEIARLPNRFQRNCASDVAATYTLRPDGKITVLNECRKADGSSKSAKGTARVADSKGPKTKLKVTFFWPFSGDYWILDLDPEYRWVLVGEPSRKYLWILSREPQIPRTEYDRLVEIARRQGFQVEALMRTRQSSAPPAS